MRVAFLGGGTGGHLAPGIGVAEELARGGHESLFLIAGRPVEERMLHSRGLPSHSLFGPTGRPGLHRVPAWVRATARYRRSLAGFDPDVVVVLGGWVALPAVWGGFGARASVLVEPNARPGKVQRLMSGRVDHACLAAEAPGMPKGRRTTRVTGVPLPALSRRDHGGACRTLGLDAERRTLVVTGGSQGAAHLNALVPRLAAALAETDERWQILNITGDAGASKESDEEPEPVPVHRLSFASDMASVWCAADVAVCRAGAGTVAELAATGTPAVLVPYPYHADHHQELNGRALTAAGAAFLVPRDDPTGERTAVTLLQRALPQLETMGAAARRLGRPEAARLVAAIVERAGVERGAGSTPRADDERESSPDGDASGGAASR